MSFIGHISGTKNYNIGSMLNFVRHEQTFFMNTNKLIQQSSLQLVELLLSTRVFIISANQTVF